MPVDRPATVSNYLEESQVFLHNLNKVERHDGRRLSASVYVDGFHPWWFSQEFLFWFLVVPYMKHQWELRPLFGAGVGDAHALDYESRAVWARLECERGLVPVPRRPLAWRDRARLQSLALLSMAAVFSFRVRGSRTLLYAIDILSPGLDHDFRISAIYRELHARGYRYGEYVHFVEPSSALENFRRRKRLAVYFEAFSALAVARRRGWCDEVAGQADACDFSAFGKDANFARAIARWALRAARESAIEVRVLRRLLRWHGVKRAVVLDDSRHANELVAACKCLGIPVLGYMHGLLNRYHMGLMACGFDNARRHSFDLYGLWSEYFRGRVTDGELYTDAETFVCGPLRLPTPKERAGLAANPRNSTPRIRVLLASEPRAPQDEVAAYVRALLADERFVVQVKTRPGESQPHACRGLSDAERSRIVLISGGTVFDAFCSSDVVAATYSSVLYEAALALRPAVCLKSTFAYGEDIAQDGLADTSQTPAGVCDIVARVAGTSGAELDRRCRMIWGDRIEDGARALFDEAERRLWSCPS